MKSAASAVCALVLGLASAVRAQDQGPGNLGIYADAAGTVACANVPPYTATVLYLVATPGALTSAGLTGAEFRVELANPAGWMITYTPPPAANVVMGDPIDTNPDPDTGGGVTMGFSSCQPPSPTGKVSLGTISVFNAGGSSTSLSIRRHSTPTNSNYACPLFLACDAPMYSKYCMAPSQASVCSTLTVPKAWATTTDDRVVAVLSLSPEAIAVQGGAPFTETINLSGAELWVMGQQITTGSVSCEFDGSSLRIGGIAVPLAAEVPVFSDSILLQSYGSVPYVTQKIGEGFPVAAAVELFEAERRAIMNQVAVAFRAGDTQAVHRVLQESPLVESFAVDEVRGGYTARYRGLVLSHVTSGDMRTWPSSTTPTGKPLADVARGYLDPIVGQATAGHLIMVTSGGVFGWRGEASSQVRGQIDHLLNGGSLETLPPGPLDPGLGAVREIIAASGRVRK